MNILGARRASPAALVLFDIDGTLIRRAGPHHREVLEEAVWRTARLSASTAEIPTQGMLDRDIISLMLRQAGVPVRQIAALLPEIMRCAQALYVRRCPDLQRKVCPGVRRALLELSRRNVLLGVVTGNLSRIGWKKLERAGIKSHFRFGAFAESGRTRAALVRLAVGEAKKRGWINRTTPITLIGDHPNDIGAAKASGVRSVAVATGLVGAAELATHEPDLLVDDLRSLDMDLLLC